MTNHVWQKTIVVAGIVSSTNVTGCVGNEYAESLEENTAETTQNLAKIYIEETDGTYYDTYSMSFKPASNACVEWYRGYGCHAIAWKGNAHNANCTSTRPYVTSYPQNATCNNSLSPSDTCLNQQEANTNIFYPVDPCGGWQYSNTFNNAGELAVGIAMAMYHYKTPTYVQMNYDINGDGFEDVGVAAIESITFSVYDTWGYTNLHSLCAFWGFETKPDPATGHDIDDVDFTCASLEDPEFDIQSVQIAFWSASNPSINRQNRTLSGTQFAYATRWVTQYIYDPPSVEAGANLQTRVRMMAQKFGERINFRANDKRRISMKDTRVSGWFTPALDRDHQ